MFVHSEPLSAYHTLCFMTLMELEDRSCLPQIDVNLRTTSSVVLLNSLLKRSSITRKVRAASMFGTLTTSRVERHNSRHVVLFPLHCT
jgi:hypothetical protein